MLISPLARKLCTAQSIDPATLKGTGPRGRIMSCDLVASAPRQPRSFSPGRTVIASDFLPPTRPEKEGYFVYDCDVDMRALASMSLPIAVQCDKFFSKPYSLMDYILRALTKACSPSVPEDDTIDVLLFVDKGNRRVAHVDARNQTIYQSSSRFEEGLCEVPAGFAPNVILCDTYTEREQVRSQLESSHRTRYAMVLRGGTPKAGIQVGSKVRSLMLPYTFYVSSKVSRKEADHAAARLNSLLYCPVSLLFIS